ncbi:hypothetical protein SeLEV6574_g08161 [Synchytrium endobioticum]|uniref:ATP-dependent rRNA helicase SPB4-like C-terminal extension domain-containing protein n=1 Tax=Synchytrium endobioticum TaxID=286115 RepID=A0A507C7Y4_9FUNG|nr:hypothetical protein SeLEV6574_g08161 [Synchytrium endobioticum]
MTDAVHELVKAGLRNPARIVITQPISMKAFVSWVRAYKEHHANAIFQLRKVDIADLARGFGLLRLPKMPEISPKDISAFTPAEVNVRQSL